jgi:protein-tyrosine phosphatase
MIDLHTHVLPGVDDGPDDIEGSLAILRVAAGEGVECMVATPHVREDYLEGPERIRPLVDEVQRAADAEGIGVAIVDGAEVAGSILLDFDDVTVTRCCLAGGPYILVESPYSRLPGHFAESVSDLQLKGYRPVLAHPERCRAFLSDRGVLEDLLENGVMTSVTAASMAGSFGSRVEELTAWLFAEGHVHNVASDCHDARNRPPGLRFGFERLDEHLPGLAEQAGWYTTDAPRAMLAGEELPGRPEPPRPRRSGLGRLRRAGGARSRR